MEEKENLENKDINMDKQPEIEQNKNDNSQNNNEKINLGNSSPEINSNPEEKIVKNDNIIINGEEKKIINTDNIINNNIINNDIINNNIINNNNINNNNINDNNNIQLTPLRKNIRQYNFDNLSKEEKIEQIEKNLHSLLSELSSLKQKGNELFANKNYEGAEQQYMEGIKKIEESELLSDIDEVNGQIQEYILNINKLNVNFYNNLSSALFKQGKYKESLKNSEFIIHNLCQEHVVSYCRILFCLIELKKIIEANYYAEIIKKKFANQNCFSNFHEQLAKLELLNREFSSKILNQNPELKQEVINMNDDLKIKKEEKNENNGYKKYIPYLVGGAILLFAGGRLLYKKIKDKQ
jgi:hypothetical protein